MTLARSDSSARVGLALCIALVAHSPGLFAHPEAGPVDDGTVPLSAKLDPHPTLILGPVEIEGRTNYKVRGEAFAARNLAIGPGLGILASPWSTPVGHRARVGLRVRAYDYLEMGFDIQDVRRFGSEIPLPGRPPDPTLFGFAAPAVDFHQAFIVGQLGGVSVTVGRQEISIDSERLIGIADWALQSRSFDGATARTDLLVGKLTLFAFQVRDKDGGTPLNPLDDDMMGGVHFMTKDPTWLPKGLVKFAPLLVVDGRSGLSRIRSTFGQRLFGGIWGWKYDLETYGQVARTGANFTGAFLVAGRTSFGLDNVLGKPRAGVLLDVVSGNPDPTVPGGLAAFDTLYGTNHKFYGWADLFLNLPLNTNQRGLTNAAVFFKASQGMFSTNAFLHVHAPSVPVEAFWGLYGIEPNLNATMKVSKVLRLTAGGAVFVPASSVGISDALGRGRGVMPWAYVELEGKL